MFQNEDNMRFALEQGFVRGKYQLIPGSGVALDRFPLQDYPEGGNGITGVPVIFNYIGRIMREKGVDIYMEMAQKIRGKYPNTEFDLIGFIEPAEAHYRKKISELEQKGIIVYRGEQDDVLPWIKRSHAVIHPSIYGEGNVLLENAACGRPIITTDTPGCRETVVDGVSGFICPKDDLNELINSIEAILKLPNNTRKQMGLEGRLKAVQEYDRKIVIREYLRAIRKTLHEANHLKRT